VVHVLAGRTIDAEIAVAMAVACGVGAGAGAALAGRLPARSLAHGFAVLVVGVALYLVVSVALLDGPPAG
jgi:uncharacterized membrane protein YfcA